MKTHVFVATTQGLVAIQNITAIDDEDISSVVSVNGTSTTANISSSYHNFVKKGVGIIQQMFGACSYRVDISARIDQGNSWQLAMFLGHLAQSKGMLGDGEVASGDNVICATGEVNTTNQQVLAVNKVALKYKLAFSQLQQWSALGAKVQFLVPQGNQEQLGKNDYTMIVNNLEDAASALPSTTTPQSKPTTSAIKTVSTHYLRTIIIMSIILFCVLIYGFKAVILPEDTQHQDTINPAQASQAISSPQIHVQALLRQNKSCETATSKTLPSSNKVFADLTLKQICELYLVAPPSQVQVLLIAQDAYTVLPLSHSTEGWRIPLPKHRLSNRSYFLVTLADALSEEEIESLRLYRENLSKPQQLTKTKLTNWLQTQHIESSIYTHRLLVD
ncbi:hypothetical protein [Paraglaciecola arctica]|uniref:hypothetical protein n=1 Tax=Paraglaciecola arctica TaxID=1128911 RepID=UPI001C071D74|nr:hypothetical protein [Paraglaciecola arctica]MBU3003120.1 hypothetical protein [Paraglaciecola arctica]